MMNNGGFQAKACRALGLATLLAAVPLAAQPEVPPRILPDEVRQVVEKLGGSSVAVAGMLGITELAGKSLNGGSPPGNANAKKLIDVPVGNHPTKHENEPTVAANPRKKKHLVAGSHRFGLPAPTANRCVAYTSSDSGETWSAPFSMPQLGASSSCSDPVVAYAPDGSRVYYSYMDIKDTLDFTGFPASFTETIDFDILVSRSSNDGGSWAGPVIALDGDPTVITYVPCPSPPFPPGSYCGTITDPGFIYDKNWVGAHVDAGESNWVYVTATRFNQGTPGLSNGIEFSRSSDSGASFGGVTTLDTTALAGSAVVQGSRPTGGLGAEVLAAWYDSGPVWLSGSFRIRTRRSGDHGATWDPVVTAVTDSSEAPFWLGPSAFYHRWWGTMFPDVEIGPNGVAHIVYTHDPVDGSATPEDGDIRYITSTAAPYESGSWSGPVTISDDTLGRAQGYPAMKLQHGDGVKDSHVLVIWEDHRLSPAFATSFPFSPNLMYDIFFARKPPTGPWFTNFRVSETSSINDFVFIGDYNDLAANSSIKFAIWTDRRDKTTIFDFEDDVYGSLIIAGGGSP